MKRTGRRAAGAVRAATAWWAFAASSWGQAPEAWVTVECPSLDAEHRAALEARAKSALLVRQAAGTLGFECRGREAAVSWTPAGAPAAREVAALPADPDASVETLLELAERLFTPVPASTPVESTGTPPARSPDAQGVSPAEEPRRASAEQRLPGPREEPSRSVDGIPFAAAVGGAVEYWHSVLAVGPDALVGWHALDLLRFDAGATLLLSTAHPLGISGRLLRLHAGAELEAAERVRVGARVLWDSMTATPEPELGVPEASDTSGGARLHAAYALPIGRGLSLVAVPFVSLRAAPVRVELGNREAFRIPIATGGVEVQVEWDAR